MLKYATYRLLVFATACTTLHTYTTTTHITAYNVLLTCGRVMRRCEKPLHESGQPSKAQPLSGVNSSP